MTTFLIGYDLNKNAPPGQYDDLMAAIKDLSGGTWWHHLESTWIVVSELSAENIRDHLRGYLDSNDELLVVKLSGSGAWTGFSESGSSWLLQNL